MNFSQKLKEIRISKKLTQSQIANILNIAIRQYQRYEYGTSDPTREVLIKLADYFDVSLDYLVCRTDDPKLHTLNEK